MIIIYQQEIEDANVNVMTSLSSKKINYIEVAVGYD